MTEVMRGAEAVLPRELAPGVFWISGCVKNRMGSFGVHSYQSAYVVVGEERTMIVDQGNPKDRAALDRQLGEVLAAGAPPVELLLPTHCEPAHSGNLNRMLQRFPEARVVGDLRDYHLIFPELASSFGESTPVGTRFDLGGRTVELVAPPLADGPTTVWAYDDRTRTLFTADAFSHLHYHGDGQCGMLAEETPALPILELTAMFSEAAFFWTRVVDIEPVVEALERTFRERPVEVVAPGHGSPSRDAATSLETTIEGLRLGQTTGRPALAQRVIALHGEAGESEGGVAGHDLGRSV
jgi:flavorubredoxin